MALKEHIYAQHQDVLFSLSASASEFLPHKDYIWDIYKAGLSVKERESIPIVGPAVDRRAFQRTSYVYSDTRIRCLMCFCCNQKKLDTGSIRSEIEFRSGTWLFSLPQGSLTKCFSMSSFSERYAASGSPLAVVGNLSGSDVASPDFSQWQVTLHPNLKQLLLENFSGDVPVRWKEIDALKSTSLLCCPEDQKCCNEECVKNGYLCPQCKVPICTTCRMHLQDNEIGPQMLINDNWIGYIESWIHEAQVTWMEKTVTSPYWTALTLFTLARRDGKKTERKRHKLHDAMYSTNARVAFKGQLYSAPMDWRSIADQLDLLDRDVRVSDLPVVGELLQKRVRLSISSGLVDLNKYLQQATVRHDVMVRLIAMHKAAGKPDYQHLDMRKVEERARMLNASNEPAIPTGLDDVLDSSEDEKFDGATDKAATPAERVFSASGLETEMQRARPLTLVVQRDSDAQKEVEASRTHALSTVSTLTFNTGSTLLDQFKSSYIPRVFNLTLPRHVGGPDFQRQTHWRRVFEDAPLLKLPEYTAMMARRSESQIGWDWDLNPGLQSLTFASQTNQGMGISFKKGLRKLQDAAKDPQDTDIGLAMKRLYALLEVGEYLDDKGNRKPINRDISKLHKVIGVSAFQKHVLQNVFFMSSRLPGTRQIRKMIGHVITAARVIHGNPLFVTATPSERHSGLAVHFSRYRLQDPGLVVRRPEFKPYVGYDCPSLFANDDMESITIDLPTYETRRMMTSQDPLCCLYAFLVSMKVVLPNLYGFRMCPHCPHCVESDEPCSDIFGSNATPLGGSTGRADAMIGAV